VSSQVTACPACGRESATTEDGRCHFCGQRKPVPVEPEPEPVSTLTGPPPPEPSTWEDLRPQLIAVAFAVLIALLGVLAGSSLLLFLAAAVLVASAVAKIVADGW
jgi:hypothetical protein